ncbi:unnamed protein product [Lepidochelys kempii]
MIGREVPVLRQGFCRSLEGDGTRGRPCSTERASHKKNLSFFPSLPLLTLSSLLSVSLPPFFSLSLIFLTTKGGSRILYLYIVLHRPRICVGEMRIMYAH